MRDGKRDGKERVGRERRASRGGREGMKGYPLNVYDRRRGEKRIKEDPNSVPLTSPTERWEKVEGG